MGIIHSIILGIVEGLTEFLPISSTAHVDFTRYFLNIPPTSFLKSYEIIIQLGAILAVVVLYARKVFSSWIYIRNLIIAFIPTGIIGFLLYKIIKSFLLGNIKIEAISLIIGGIIILFFEYYSQRKINISPKTEIEKLNFRELIILGIAQSLAVIPGISRSGAVIIAGRAINLDKNLITEFSFLLAVPTMFSATVYDMYKSEFSFTQSEWGTILIGFIVAFVVAFIVIKWFLNYIRKNSFKIFGWYRIIFGLIILIFFFFK